MVDNILEPYCNLNLDNGCLNDIASGQKQNMQRFLLETLVPECQMIWFQIRTNVV